MIGMISLDDGIGTCGKTGRACRLRRQPTLRMDG